MVSFAGYSSDKMVRPMLTMSALIALATEIVVLHTHPLPHSILWRCVWAYSYNLQGEERERERKEEGAEGAEREERLLSSCLYRSTDLSYCLMARCEGDLGYGLCHCRGER